MGQGGSHTREAVLVLMLFLLFGAYRLYSAAEAEQEIPVSSVENPDNILLPAPANMTIRESFHLRPTNISSGANEFPASSLQPPSSEVPSPQVVESSNGPSDTSVDNRTEVIARDQSAEKPLVDG